MASTIIRPVSDLRDYNKVLKECVNGEPVLLTKNGRGAFVVMSVEEYDKMLKLCAIGAMRKIMQED